MTKTQKNKAVKILHAINYLKRNDVDVFSRSDKHYLTAIYISAGITENDNCVIEHIKTFNNNK